MTGYFVGAAIGELEVFDLMVVTGEPVVNGNSVTAADRYGQAVACFAQQHVGAEIPLPNCRVSLPLSSWMVSRP